MVKPYNTPTSFDQPRVGRRRTWNVEVDPETGCHIWLGAKFPNGYGMLRREGKKFGAHRWAYMEQIGPIPEGMFLDHLCCNPSCVNVEHLEPVTNATNQQRGDAAKLSWDDVRFIREHIIERHPEFGFRALGRRFGVSHETIRHVVYGDTWQVVAPALV